MKQQPSHSIVSKILSTGIDKKRLPSVTRVIKETSRYEDLCNITDNILKTIKPLGFYFYGTPTPKSYRELGHGNLYYPRSVDNEINWTILSIRDHKEEIQEFVLVKALFEESFLLGDYSKADSIITTFKNKYGLSIWYIEAKFLLLEYQNKSDQQKILLSDINKEISTNQEKENENKNGVVTSLLYYLSQRTEKNISAYKYDYDLKRNYHRPSNGKKLDISDYYLFRLNFFEAQEVKNYGLLLAIENFNSVFDRYNFLINVFKAMYVQDVMRDFVYSRASYLYKKVKDKSLLPLLASGNMVDISTDYYDDQFIDLLDLFYAGRHTEMIEKCQSYVHTNPSDFDILVLYCKSLVSLNIDYVDITNNKLSTLNVICRYIYQIFINNTEEDYNYKLYQINKNIHNFNLNYGLDNFLKKNDKNKSNLLLKLTSISHYDPFFSLLYEDKDDAEKYLMEGIRLFPNSLAIQHWLKVNRNHIDCNSKLTPEILKVDNAKTLFRLEQYEKSLEDWKVLIENFKSNNPIRQKAIKYTFNCFVELEKYDDAIKFYVDHLVNDISSISKINPEKLLTILRKLRYTGIKRTIDLPIMISMISNDDSEKSFIQEQFCSLFNKEKPSELFSLPISNDIRRNAIFFYNACSQDILKHSIYINNTMERLSERLSIVNHLIDISPENLIELQQERDLLANEIIVHEGTQKLDESKIYANDQAIINTELKDIEGVYTRYKTIHKLYINDQHLYLVAGNNIAQVVFANEELFDNTSEKYTDNALVEVFADIFDNILDRFLYSKFGIVAYLSTRIRHGVLLGELRPEFDKRNIILNKKGNTAEYNDSRYWSNAYFGLSPVELHSLNNILKDFSAAVDSLINKIIKQKIQIKRNDENTEGLFNYEFSKEELFQYALQLGKENDYKSFCQAVINLLWLRTDINLESIREYFNTNVTETFSSLLTNLESQLNKRFDRESFPEIFTNVHECSTVIGQKINRISQWFRRSGSTINDFNIKRLFDVVWSNTIKCYPKIKAECNAQITTNITIKASYYIHFVDLLRIFLDNILQYSGKENGIIRFDFMCYETDSVLLCTFCNKKPDNFQELPIYQFSDKIKIDMDKLTSEGKSGLSKAMKIVKFDLGNIDNQITIDIEDPKDFVVKIYIDTTNLIKNDEEDINC